MAADAPLAVAAVLQRGHRDIQLDVLLAPEQSPLPRFSKSAASKSVRSMDASPARYSPPSLRSTPVVESCPEPRRHGERATRRERAGRDGGLAKPRNRDVSSRTKHHSGESPMRPQKEVAARGGRRSTRGLRAAHRTPPMVESSRPSPSTCVCVLHRQRGLCAG